jgi:serine/threonine protein kinase
MQVSKAVCLQHDDFEVAIKQLCTVQCTAESSREALVKDLHVSAELSSHPRIMEVVDVLYDVHATHNDASIVALVYKLHKCGSLHDHVGYRTFSPGSAVALPTALEVMLDVMSGLRHMHGRNIVHCDIKEGNILISDDRRYIVSDYGLSCNKGGMSHMGCTFEYAAPEVCSAGECK